MTDIYNLSSNFKKKIQIHTSSDWPITAFCCQMFLNNDCCLGRCRITDRSFCKSFWNATNRQNKSQNNPFWSKTPLLYAGFTLNILLGLILWQWQADHTYTHAAISRYQCNPFKSSSAYFCAAKTNSFKYTTNVTLSLLGIMGCSRQFSVAYSP